MSSPIEVAHLQIPLEEILKATNNFANENLIGQGAFCKVYKGNLMWLGQSMNIAARRLHHDYGQGETEFWKEIMMLACLNHENVVPIIGFCDENNEKIIINKHEAKGSLDKFLSNPTLTWMQRLQICVDVARALRYIYYDVGNDLSFIHRNIKSSKILLDDKWKPKLFGFGISLKSTRVRRHRLLLAEATGTIGYIDPLYQETGFVTHKSDVYSLGVVLFEVLCGKRAFISEKTADEILSKTNRSKPTFLNYMSIVGAVDIVISAIKNRWTRNDYGTQSPKSMVESSEPEQLSTQIVTQTDNEGNPDEMSHTKVPEETRSSSSSFEHKQQSSLPIEDASSKEPLFNPLYTMTKLDRYIHSPNEELLAQLAKSHYEDETLDEIIDPNLRKQINSNSFDLFTETAYSCLMDQRSQRPNIDQIVSKLEEALEFQQKPDQKDPEVASGAKGGISLNRLKGGKLKHLKIPLTDIKLATKNFSETHLIGSGTYGKVYKAELDLPVEEKNKYYLSKRRTVAIKRILVRGDGLAQKGFISEISLLSSCKHPNIVSLLGFCHEDSHMILVYEYASNGSLDDYLGSTNKFIDLTWAQRLKICIDIACGLNYLHTKVEDDQRIIHRDVKSGNILLGKKWEAKISDFGLSRFRPEKQEANTLNTNNIAGTNVYMDPEYERSGKLKNESDIYSFGVVLFEILSGKIAYDPIFIAEDNKGLAPYARQRIKEGKIYELVDPKIMEEVHELISTQNKGPNQDSLNTFIRIANQCISETQNKRPTAEVIMKKLEKALSFQENHKDSLQISHKDIMVATRNFSNGNRIKVGRFGDVYEGELTHANGSCNRIVAKRLRKSQGQGQHAFLTELEVLFEYKHENIIGLVGYCSEEDEKIIVYEHASRGSLDKHLGDTSLNWMKRLKICVDVASGLAYLHGGALTKEMVIHRDIKSANILLSDDWKAKISNFGLSSIGYVDPLYKRMGFLTEESDIYSFGVLLFEIVYGKLLVPDAWIHYQQRESRMLNYIHDEGKLDQIVLCGIRKQMAPESLSKFSKIVGQCLDNDRKKRPTAEEVLQQLKEALAYQEDYEIWEPKLPRDYKDIIQLSKSPEIYSAQKKKDICNIFSKGIHLQHDKVLFSLGSNGERNKMVSASEFSYISDCSPHEWQSVPESKFKKVAEMLDTTNLMIKIEIKTDLLSPNVTYGVHLLFKFCDSRKVSSKPVYVNLKYKKGSETLYAYFATWRDDNWMTVELCRFLNHREVSTLTFLLERFSTYYCGDEAIYVEGIEFRAIHNVKREEIEQKNDIQQVMESDMSVDQVQQLTNYDEGEKLFSLTEVHGKKHLNLPAKAALHEFTNVTLFSTKSSAESRFHEGIELPPQQVFRIDCKIESHMLSPDTEYVCYLVFKLSEQCGGLHCPVKVRDLLKRKTEEAGIIYLIPPSPWNIHDLIKIPRQRTDGLMEVEVWKFDSTHDLKNNCLPMNLRLTSYEGTMSGLIVCGLEFRPM